MEVRRGSVLGHAVYFLDTCLRRELVVIFSTRNSVFPLSVCGYEMATREEAQEISLRNLSKIAHINSELT